ncbi:hypothetical protein CBF23_003500 [Marinomonas agarivorans]|nr:hypothetical protein CBF23_003500 [Marinomonas agarivorans]
MAVRLFTFSFSILLLAGCATYKQDIDSGLNLAQKGQWQEAEKAIELALDSDQDTLLRLLEQGALAQYQGDFTRSNELLEQAEKLSDTFLEESLTNRSLALVTNERQKNYTATGFERIYINFFKSLNYLALAEQATTQQKRQSLLDSALVESRRIDLKLNEISTLTPSYEDINGKNKSISKKALTWLSGFYTGGIKTEDFVYRDDAWGRYVQGLQYEISGEYDDARIAYQQAAQLYDAGYRKQYALPDDVGQRAWLDTIRMMQKAGGWEAEYPALIKEKLSEKYQALLASYQGKEAELVVLEAQGFVPARKELNMALYASPRDYSLVLEPVLGGTQQEARDASRWFSMVYADTNILNLLANYKAGGAWSTIAGVFTKRVILGRAVWRQLENLSIDQMLYEAPIRIAVPYYDPFTVAQGNTRLLQSSSADSSLLTETALRMTSIADIAIQEQLSHAHRDIYEALIKELVRNQIAYQASKQFEDPAANLLIGLIGKVAVLASVAADTRAWLTLPAQIRIVRQPITAGTQSFTYEAQSQQFHLNDVTINKNDIKVWKIRNPY